MREVAWHIKYEKILTFHFKTQSHTNRNVQIHTWVKSKMVYLRWNRQVIRKSAAAKDEDSDVWLKINFTHWCWVVEWLLTYFEQWCGTWCFKSSKKFYIQSILYLRIVYPVVTFSSLAHLHANILRIYMWCTLLRFYFDKSSPFSLLEILHYVFCTVYDVYHYVL